MGLKNFLKRYDASQPRGMSLTGRHRGPNLLLPTRHSSWKTRRSNIILPPAAMAARMMSRQLQWACQCLPHRPCV